MYPASTVRSTAVQIFCGAPPPKRRILRLRAAGLRLPSRRVSPMPSPKIALNLIASASLVLSAGWLCAQQTSTPSTPQQTPSAQAPASAPNQSQDQTQDQSQPRSAPTLQAPTPAPSPNDQADETCPGPVLHRKTGGEICSSGAPPSATPAGSDDTETATN